MGDQEEEANHVEEVNRVGEVEVEVVGVVSHVDGANRVGAVDRMAEAGHEVVANHVVEVGASQEVDHVMVEANREDVGIQVHPLLITIDDVLECVGDHPQLHHDGNQIDHVILVDLEVKIEGKTSCSCSSPGPELSPGPFKTSLKLTTTFEASLQHYV